MNLSNEFHPVPKPVSKKPNRTKRKGKIKGFEVVQGVKIPHRKIRGRITREQYNKALREHGEYCWVCGTTSNLECHHVMPKGYSRIKSGRGVWRNLRFLCPEHHRGKTGVHQIRELMQKLQDEHERLYGPYYYCDKYDLYKMNLIPNTTDEAYEEFMRGEENGKEKTK